MLAALTLNNNSNPAAVGLDPCAMVPMPTSATSTAAASANGGEAEAKQQQNNGTASKQQSNGGMDCYADDREALNDFAKYFNNAHLSDLALAVGDEIFSAHRLILCRSSEVFDRMLSQKWNEDDKKEIELKEEPQCQPVFGAFLRFLYCNHIVLNADNALPLLILADKYNVQGLKKICIDFAINYVLPELGLKELFHLWFNYSTKAYHPSLIKVCVEILGKSFKELATSVDWDREWAQLDRDQLVEFLRSNDLLVPNEFFVWEAVLKWLSAPSHPERRGNTCAPLLVQILPLIRFPFMSAEELHLVEESKLAKLHSKLIAQHTHLAFKWLATPLVGRTKLINSESNGPQFLLRNYTDVQWDKRLRVTAEQLFMRNQDHSFKLTTRSGSLTLPSWEWKLDLQVVQASLQQQATSVAEDQLRVALTATDVDHTGRSVEWAMMVCGQRRVLRSATGTKLFTKSRYSADLDLRGKVEAAELFAEHSPLLTDGDLYLQLHLRPIS